MVAVFDDTAYEYLKLMGYKYFCHRQIAPQLDPEEGMVVYWLLTPFKTKAGALKNYLRLQKANMACQVWSETEHLKELAGSLFGLIVYVKLPEDVLS